MLGELLVKVVVEMGAVRGDEWGEEFSFLEEGEDEEELLVELSDELSEPDNAGRVSEQGVCYDVAVVQGVFDSRLSSEKIGGNYCSERVGVRRTSARPDGSVINDEASELLSLRAMRLVSWPSS
jgi:hypothetical protein